MLTKTIPSYLYQQYSGDTDLEAFVSGYNTIAQEFVDWFNTIGLPIYTGDQINGLLLDWVGEGVYGLPRPVLSNGQYKTLGLYGSVKYGTHKYGTGQTVNSAPYYATPDEVYKRILTWRFYKGDGFVFSTEWLKRRVMRFLNGTNGTAPNIDNTYQVSVTISGVNLVTIRFYTTIIDINLQGYGVSKYGTTQYGGFSKTSTSYPDNPYVAYLKAAINSGILDLPFQYEFQLLH